MLLERLWNELGWEKLARPVAILVGRFAGIVDLDGSIIGVIERK